MAAAFVNFLRAQMGVLRITEAPESLSESPFRGSVIASVLRLATDKADIAG